MRILRSSVFSNHVGTRVEICFLKRVSSRVICWTSYDFCQKRLDMVRFRATRPVFSVPWLQFGRCGVNDVYILGNSGISLGFSVLFQLGWLVNSLFQLSRFGDLFLKIISLLDEQQPFGCFDLVVSDLYERITIYRRSISPTTEGSVVDACVAWHRTRVTVWQLSALAEPPYRRFHREIWIFWSFYLEVSNRKRDATSRRTCFRTFLPKPEFWVKSRKLLELFDKSLLLWSKEVQRGGDIL